MKKWFLFIITVCVSLSIPCHAMPIFTFREEIPISKSITLTKAHAFYPDFDLQYSVIRADLADEDTALRLLTSTQGNDIMEPVGTLAESEENVVAALNADFFSAYKGKQGFSLGLAIRDGKLIQSPINPSTMATVSYKDHMAAMSYLDFHIMAVAPDWAYHEIRHVNKHTDYYGDILMYSGDFGGGYSPAPGGEVLEVVVEDGIVTEFRRNMPPVKIPENGCVLVVSEGVNMFFANHFQVGDPIRFDYYVTPDILEAETAFGGGAMLVSEGKVVDTFSHVIAGEHPRSAIGVDKEGKTLYLVAVDGRQKESQGLRMRKLAELMQSLGCYTAVNLDGGGSTHMVASTVWDEKLHAVNAPTENRSVINAVGLTYDGEPGEPEGILLETDKTAVFIGEPVTVSAALYDKNQRPATGEIELSSDDGEIEGNRFIPRKGGTATIRAASGEIEETVEIYAVDQISGISIPALLPLQKGESQSLSIEVFDKAGHHVAVNHTDRFTITSSNPAVAKVSGQVVTAVGEGTALVSVEKDGVKSYTSVYVGKYAEQKMHGFAFAEGFFSAYPSFVGGSYTESDAHHAEGEKSGRLSFDFTEGEGEKSAHFVLADRPILSEKENTVSIRFYSDNDFEHTLHAQFSCGGQILTYPFQGECRKGLWQTLELEIPADAPRPLCLDSIFVLGKEDEAQDAGEVYLDALSYWVDTPYKPEVAPGNVYAVEEGKGEAHFSVVPWYEGDTLSARLSNAKGERVMEENMTGAWLGKEKAFRAEEDANALYITLGTHKGGIRKTDASQWEKMQSAIANTDRENIFLLADASVFGASEFENETLKAYLASLPQDVFVIMRGDTNAFLEIDGVKYFTLGTYPKASLSPQRVKSQKYLTFSFGEETTFGWKTLYEREA